MVIDRAFIFYIYIPLAKTLSSAPKSRSSVKVRYQGLSFQKLAIVGALVFHKHSFLDTDLKGFFPRQGSGVTCSPSISRTSWPISLKLH